MDRQAHVTRRQLRHHRQVGRVGCRATSLARIRCRTGSSRVRVCREIRAHISVRKLVPGSSPSAKALRAASASPGKRRRRMSPAARSAVRMRRVSSSNRMTWSAPPSRAFRASRRSMAWTSVRAVSASIPHRHVDPLTTASHARRSPWIANGTSVPHASDRSHRDLRRSRRATWAASRIGSPAGYARTARSSPSTAHIRLAVWMERFGLEPRSSLPYWDRERPSARATSACARPAARRAALTSSTRRETAYLARSSPMSTALARVPIRSRCHGVLTRGLLACNARR